MQCQLCLGEYNHLGSHIAMKHKMKAREYKAMFNLDLKYPLVSLEIRLKQKQNWENNKEQNLKNLSFGNKYRFKEGEQNRKYFSKQTIDRAVDNLKLINNKKQEICQVCKMKTKHLASHLYNKHNLLTIKK